MGIQNTREIVAKYRLIEIGRCNQIGLWKLVLRPLGILGYFCALLAWKNALDHGPW